MRISYSYSMAHLTEALQPHRQLSGGAGRLMPDHVPGNAARVLCRACADYEQAQVDAAVEAVFAFCQNAAAAWAAQPRAAEAEPAGKAPAGAGRHHAPGGGGRVHPRLCAPRRSAAEHHGGRFTRRRMDAEAACAPFMRRAAWPPYAKRRARRFTSAAKRACAKRRASACARSTLIEPVLDARFYH